MASCGRGTKDLDRPADTVGLADNDQVGFDDSFDIVERNIVGKQTIERRQKDFAGLSGKYAEKRRNNRPSNR